MPRPPPCSTLFPYTTLFRSCGLPARWPGLHRRRRGATRAHPLARWGVPPPSPRRSTGARVDERPGGERDNQSCDEATDVRPVRDARGLLAHRDRPEPVDELEERPDPDHHDRWYRDRPEEHDAERDEDADAVGREEDEIRREHAADRAGCAQTRDDRLRIGRDLREGGDDPAEEIEDQVLEGTERLLDVVAEDEEEKHVAPDVQPSAVHEHRGEEGEPDRHRSRRLVDLHGRAIWGGDHERADEVFAGRDLRGNGAVAVGETGIDELVQEDEDGQDDDRNVDDG